MAVTLWNTGEEAYRPHVFGDRITIERRITGSGASKYRVLTAQDRAVSDKRDDMQACGRRTLPSRSSIRLSEAQRRG